MNEHNLTELQRDELERMVREYHEGVMNCSTLVSEITDGRLNIDERLQVHVVSTRVDFGLTQHV